jgi:lipoprotein NlpI
VSDRRAASVILALLACTAALGTATAAPKPQVAKTARDSFTATPLLDLALGEKFERIPDVVANMRNLKQAQHTLKQAHPPADADCAAGLGAARFASLYMDVGSAYSAHGDHRAALGSYQSALACRPYDVWILLAVATAQFHIRDLVAAKRTLDTGLRLQPRSVHLHRLAGNIAFVNEQWAEAVSRFRFAATGDPDRTQASYAQIMLWLAEARAGVAEPELIERQSPGGWPVPLMQYLRGVFTETDIVEAVELGAKEDETPGRQERLCEALFYVGHARWARGERDVALSYFTAVVNLKVVYFVEHDLARAEIAKMATAKKATAP